MAVGMDVTIYTAVNLTGTIVTETAIGDDTVSLIITPTKACRKLIFILTNGGAAYTVDVAKGDYWAGKAMTQVAMATEKRVFIFEAAESYKSQVSVAAPAVYADRIKITLSAAATTTTTYLCIELP